jgi:hypothetical protein
MNNRNLEIIAATAALLVTLVTAVVTVETRYAKSAEVQAKINDLYARQLKLRILELQLKPETQFTAADKALLDYMQQELRETVEN